MNKVTFWQVVTMRLLLESSASSAGSLCILLKEKCKKKYS